MEFICELCGSNRFAKTPDWQFTCRDCGCLYTREQLLTLAKGSAPVSVTNTVKVADTDFIIRGGVLEKYCGESTDVVIPDNVTIIGSNAFEGCDGITSVTISKSVKEIQAGAFDPCRNLKSVHVSSLSAWFRISFANEKSNPLCHAQKLYVKETLITKLDIPNTVTEIGNNLFKGYKALTSVTVPDSVKSIGTCAFSGCTGLTSVNIMNGVKTIYSYAFEGCTGLTSITIPNSVTDIDYHAFEGCSGITSINISNSVNEIGGGAFSGCTGLKAITIPNSVRFIGIGVFAGCLNLTRLSFPIRDWLQHIGFIRGFDTYAYNKDISFIEYLFGVYEKTYGDTTIYKYSGPNEFESIAVTDADNIEIRGICHKKVKNPIVLCDSVKISTFISENETFQIFISDMYIFNRQKLSGRELIKHFRREAGVCTNCGHEFKDTLFGKKCRHCGTRKDY